MIAVRVLGPLEVAVDGVLADSGGPRQRCVLARLVAEHGRAVSADRLIEDLYAGEPPPRALAGLQAYVSHLRRILEPGRAARAAAGVLVTSPPGYALRLDCDAVDAWAFQEQVGAAVAMGDAAVVHDQLSAALESWRGPAYQEFAGMPWADLEAARLEELRLAATEWRVEAALRLGRAAEVIADLDRFAADHPLREEAWRLLALALYRSGRQGDALAALRRARTHLAGELGVDPGPALRELEGDILAQAPHLSGSPPLSPRGRSQAATRRGVLKAGLAAGVVAGTGAWRFAPGQAGPGHGGPVHRAGLLPRPASGSPDAAQPEPAGMTPYSVAGTTLTSGANQYEVDVTHPVPASDGLVVAIALGGANPPSIASVTDSQSNTYIPLQLGSSNSPELAVFSPAANGNFAPLSSTDSFTITLPAGTTAPGGGCVIAYGVPDQPVIDVSVLSDINGAGTTASVTGMPRQAGETALAIFAWANNGGTGQIAIGGPFTQLAQQHAANGSYLTVANASDPAVAASLSASYTLSQSVSGFGVLLTFSTAYAGAYQVSSTSGVKGNLTYSVPVQAGSPLAPAGLPALPAGDGAVLVIAVGGTSPPAAPSVTDSQGNIWTAQALPETGSPLLYVFTAGTAAAPGIGTGLNNGSSPDALTVTFPSAPSSEPAFLIIGASMRPAVDVGVSTYASGASTSPSVTGQPANGCEVVLGLFAWANGGGTGTPAGSFTQIGQAQGGGGSYATAYYYGQALANSTQTASATITQATWRGVMLSFQVAALNWFANYAEIKSMYGTTPASQESCTDLYGPSTSMSIVLDPTAADPTTTSSVPPGPGSLPTPAFGTTPILKYSSYEQLNTDLKNPGQNPNLAKFKWLEYDIESWPPPPGANTEPPGEEQNPWSYLRQFVALAHEYGYRVMLAPALDLALVSNTLVPAKNGETNGDWTIRTGVLAACAAAGADIVHCQCQSQQPPWEPVSTFQTLFGDLYTQAQAQSAYCLITVGLRSNSPAMSSDIQNAYTSVLPQTPPAPTAQGFWMNVGSGSAPTAVQFNEQIA